MAGNAAVKAYSTQSGLILVPFSWNDQAAIAYGLDPQTGNPDLKWELTATNNIGVDFGILQNRITGSVDYYDSKTSDLLLPRALPPTSGYQRVIQNVGKTRNKGIEVALRTVNVKTTDFNWSSNITFTRNRERIVELVGKQNDVANRWIIGAPTKIFYDYEKTGIWQTEDSNAAKVYKNIPGDLKFKDQNDDKAITAADDRIVVGAAVPDYSWGFSNDFSYKNFDLNIYVFARKGQMINSDYFSKYEINGIENGANVNYWTPENPSNEYPRPTSKTSRTSLVGSSTMGYRDGSFIKIRNITLGYTLPKTLTQKFGVSSLRWYVSAKNYFTFSKISGYDPEGEGSLERPLTKLIVTGLNIDF
jgi:hypothetical protein